MGVVLSITESKYVGLPESLQIAIIMMNFPKKMQEQDVNIPNSTPVIHCKHFEDNAADIHLAKAFKMCPCAQHINQQIEVSSLLSKNG
jgi:hypothetical protein